MVSKQASASATDRFAIVSVKREADAMEIAHPDPSKPASITVSFASTCRYKRSLSPHSGLIPSAVCVALSGAGNFGVCEHDRELAHDTGLAVRYFLADCSCEHLSRFFESCDQLIDIVGIVVKA